MLSNKIVSFFRSERLTAHQKHMLIGLFKLYFMTLLNFTGYSTQLILIKTNLFDLVTYSPTCKVSIFTWLLVDPIVYTNI